MLNVANLFGISAIVDDVFWRLWGLNIFCYGEWNDNNNFRRNNMQTKKKTTQTTN